MKTIVGLFCFILLFISPVRAETSDKTTESTAIKNLPEALQKAKKALGFPVLFPSFIPDHRDDIFSAPERKQEPHYAYTQVTSHGLVIISIDYTEDCHGSKHCSLASLYITKGALPEIRKDLSGKPITTVVKLRDNIEGYYTPGHAMADYWPPSLQWVYKDTLYELWRSGIRLDDEETMDSATRNTLIDMVNSAIRSAPHEKAAP
jgi:hypothetical protein